MNNYLLILIGILLSSCAASHDENPVEEASFFSDFSFFGDDKIKIDSTYILSLKDENLILFYKKNNYKTAWEVEENRTALLNELKLCENEGLESKNYGLAEINKYETNYSDLNDSTLVVYDIELTKNAQKYLNHICKGKLQPSDVYHDWSLPKKDFDCTSTLINSLVNNDLNTTFKTLKPQHIVYQKLKNALAILQKYPNDDHIELVEIKGKILFNKKNKAVYAIKKRLIFWKDLKFKDTINSVYDKETQEAMKKFQLRHGLYPDGVVGRGTIDALNYTKSMRVEQVIANLERWRWFSNDFGANYLLINIPDYSLIAIKDNDTMQKQKVVVGKESRRTPVLESKVSNINLNPNWTVPPTILKEDIYPEAEKNPNIFRVKGLKIYDKYKKEVSPWSWKKADAYKYKYVQAPSKNNSLGSMKINFPNKYSVYLHDTNHRDYFKFHYRALSSGCVRLEKPLEMAAYIINDEEKWDLQTINDTTDINYYKKLQKIKEAKIAQNNAKLLAKNPTLIIEPKKLPKPELKTIVINITNEIYVHQLYWTAWEENGELRFREDIYCLDHDVYAKLIQ